MAISTQAIQESVQDFPSPGEIPGAGNILTLLFAQNNDTIEPWHGNTKLRDEQLAKFWKTEPFLASAVTSIATTRAALSWELTGPPKTVAKVQKILNGAEFGQGWQTLMMKVNVDLLTSDNGGFIEVIRKPASQGRNPESMPILGLAHLPAMRCLRTGNPEYPVIYYPDDGGEIVLPWWRVITLAENPVPESRVGRQFCFLSRVLKFAEITRDILTHQGEKIGGRFNKAIHVIGGLAQGEMENVQRKAQIVNDNAGLYKYVAPLILTTLDPNAKVSKETIELASLPDGFDMDQMLTWYITLMALASGSDYQEFAPLSTGNLGTASQTETLHRKSQRKGTQLFIKLIENALTQSKTIPDTLEFRFRQQDAQAEKEQAEIEKLRAETRKVQIEDGEITAAVARQIAADAGGLRQEYLLMMGNTDETPTVTVGDDETVGDALLNPENVPVSDQPASVPLDVAQRAAFTVLKTIDHHPLNVISPIPNTQLRTFVIALRNRLVKPTQVHTKNDWLADVLVGAALEAGIHPHALKMRLPDDLELYVFSQGVANKSGWLYQAKPRQKAKINPAINTLVAEFEKTWPNSQQKYQLLRDTLIKAYQLAGGEITPAKAELLGTTIQQKYHLLRYTQNVTTFTYLIYQMYYDALAQRI